MAKDKENPSHNLNQQLGRQAGLAREVDVSEYYLRNNHYLKVRCSNVKDEVEGKFLINFKQALPQFNTAFGKAYAVTKKFVDAGEVYAIILEKKYPIRLAEINKFSAQRIDNIANVIAAQVIPCSITKGRVFAVIIEQPRGITLADYMQKNGAVSPESLTRLLIPAIGIVLAKIHEMEITHGRINASNIYLDDSGQITVGECISEPCGYSQPIIYETLSRATAMPIAKGNGNEKVDYNALGVLVAILLRGKDVSDGTLQQEFLSRKFQEGTYKIVTAGMEIPPRMLDFLRGMLANRKNEVWGLSQLQDWVKGRRFNLLPPPDNVADSRPLLFNGKKYHNRKHLVHDLHINWDEGKQFVQKDTIIRWLSRHPNESQLMERLGLVSGHYGKEKTTPGFDNEDEALAHYILLLDPEGPIRLRNFSANIDGLGSALADAFATGNAANLNAIENIISYNLPLLIPPKITSAYISIQEAAGSLQKCVELLKKKDLGFGIERCLYELNKAIPCQSPLILEEITFNNEELLQAIDKNESVGGKILDNQMAAFFSDRLDLQMRINLSTLAKFPEFGTNIYIQALAILSLAQQTSHIGALPRICTKMYEGLSLVISQLHSKTIRAEMEDNLQKSVKKGVLANLLRVMSNSKYLVRDRVGFRKAVNIYKNNAIQIVKLSNSKLVGKVGYRYGLQLAVMISFFVATVEFIILLMKAF
jgi:hypothetical protein